MNKITENCYLNQLRQRNPVVFRNIYKEYKDKLLTNIILKTNGNVHAAEEILSDAFHSAIKSAPKLKNAKNIYGWLLQIANRRLADYYRKKYKEDSYFEEYNEDISVTNDDIINTIQEKEEIIMFNLAYNNMNEKYKTMLKLKYINKLSLKEISNHFGINTSTVMSQLDRAKKKLKKEFSILYLKVSQF